MKKASSSVVFILTMTPTRIGVGQAAGLIDLPIIRDASTNWPVLPGSSIKGVLKDAAKQKVLEGLQAEEQEVTGDARKVLLAKLDHDVQDVFGFKGGIGSLLITEFSILLFPVRSFTGVFAWATCPLALEKIKTLASLADVPFEADPFADVEPAADGATAMVSTSSILIDDDRIVLDEIDLAAKKDDRVDGLAKLLTELSGVSDIEKRLCVVDDDVFTFLTEQCTEVRTRTALEFQIKKAKDKSLRQEEYLPANCLFGSYGEVPSEWSLDEDRVMQIGAEASVGAGLVKWHVYVGGQQ